MYHHLSQILPKQLLAITLATKAWTPINTQYLFNTNIYQNTL